MYEQDNRKNKNVSHLVIEIIIILEAVIADLRVFKFENDKISFSNYVFTSL